MLMLENRTNVKDIIKMYKEEYPLRMAKIVNGALAETAKEMWRENRVEMRKKFNNPRPYTLNSFFVLYPSSRGALKAGIASREFTDKGVPSWKYLWLQANGGPRRDKRSEVALRAGGILPSGSQTAQGASFPKDAYGDIAGGQYTRMLAEMNSLPGTPNGRKSAQTQRQKNKPVAERTTQFFLYTPKGASQPVGIAERRGKSITIMLRFILPPTYKKLYDFYGVAQATAALQFPRQFNKIFSRYFG